MMTNRINASSRVVKISKIFLYYMLFTLDRSLPPDAKTAVVLQEELVAKDLALKRQHDDFVKQL